MLLGTLLTGEIAKSALVAYVHYLGIILCFGSLLFERLTLKVGLNRNETISMIIADVVYGDNCMEKHFPDVIEVWNKKDFFEDGQKRFLES